MKKLFVIGGLLVHGIAAAQQVAVPRIERMPDFPAPYAMRDWRRVAQGYDSLLFDLGRQGTYLPFAWITTQTVNYPGQPSFGVPSYVGSQNARGTEAINALAALVGATLSGVDKRGQFGQDWVAMAQEYFNRANGEGVYLNNPSTRSGNDWWYDTMPNVFFYQLYDLYGSVGAFDVQFRSVADRWLEAVRHMGGSAAPWRVPNMRYRGWRLASMTPNAGGVVEPEAAGALAWLLYHASVETGDVDYRMGAEQAMEYLNGLASNPSYELQLAYGAYAAARMNAELGTGYDVEKLVNWTFDVGPLRSWGAVVGRWGGYDVSGLIGEVNGTSDYAFAMNTFEQVGALVPLVRYDDRFARPVGKWVLNAANAARLFYPAFLPDANQDASAWARAHDPASVVAYEALRQSRFGNSPYATGDAVAGGWAATNLGLYGSSHVGILGGIVDTTDVPYVLRLDARRTDYFGEGYPTYLYFNPHDEARSVTVDLGAAPRDLYDAVADRFVARGVSGRTAVALPADGAVLLVLAPAGGTARTEGERLLVDGVVVDYHAGAAGANHAPRVKGLAAAAAVLPGGTTTLYCTGDDADGDTLAYRWTAAAGRLDGTGAQVQWTAPDTPGSVTVSCTAVDPLGAEGRLERAFAVVTSTPTVESVRTEPLKVPFGGTARLTCRATDPAADTLAYRWRAADGRIEGTGPVVDWIAPAADGDYFVTCRAENALGAADEDSVRVAVRDFAQGGSGPPLVYLPFDGDVRDAGPSARAATATGGARPIADPFGRPARAFHFDGSDDAVRIPNAPDLNAGEGVTLGFWLRVAAFYNREAYVVSHGSWEQRWKVSLTGERLRWTIRTDRGVYDLDGQTRLAPGRYYHVVARYDGRDVELYLDGVLDAFGTFSGALRPATVDLTVAQRVPGDTQYNFAGDVDELRLFGYPLSADAVRALHAEAVASDTEGETVLPGETQLHPAYPNPFAAEAVIRYDLGAPGTVSVRILNLLGQTVRILAGGEVQQPGAYQLRWDGTDGAGRGLAAGVYLVELQAGPTRVRRTLVRVHDR